MPIDTLQRIMWRVRARNPGVNRVNLQELRNAITLEAGYDERTYKRIKQALARLGWIKSYKTRVQITGKDLTDT